MSRFRFAGPEISLACALALTACTAPPEQEPPETSLGPPVEAVDDLCRKLEELSASLQGTVAGDNPIDTQEVIEQALDLETYFLEDEPTFGQDDPVETAANVAIAVALGIRVWRQEPEGPAVNQQVNVSAALGAVSVAIWKYCPGPQ